MSKQAWKRKLLLLEKWKLTDTHSRGDVTSWNGCLHYRSRACLQNHSGDRAAVTGLSDRLSFLLISTGNANCGRRKPTLWIRDVSSGNGLFSSRTTFLCSSFGFHTGFSWLGGDGLADCPHLYITADFNVLRPKSNHHGSVLIDSQNKNCYWPIAIVYLQT